MNTRIKKGDTVKVIAGKDKGKTGKVLRVFPDTQRISVEGVNTYKKHSRPRKEGEKGEIVVVTRPLSQSNVMILCPSCNKGVRVGVNEQGGGKTRRCMNCEAAL